MSLVDKTITLPALLQNTHADSQLEDLVFAQLAAVLSSISALFATVR
ncbi:hypothetical protein JCM19238_371 [Vibrio ponticus]|nr:hypothetical protein JCM19238_371 [Vibrio ponticus]